jgi:glucose/arabinose dehydrogenase
VLDGPKFIPGLGHTEWENGDIIMSLANAGDGSNRLFVVERQGRVWILQDGQLLPAPFLDVSNLTTTDLERGLQSIAFPPDYKTTGRFYIFYTAAGQPAGNLTLARYQVDPKNPNRALPGSGQILLSIPHQPYANHNGGGIAFGPDGMLYWFTGDGGIAKDTFNNGQNLQTLLGKALRLDVEGPPDPGLAYRIPPDNPFVKNPRARPELWAVGLRNPWRFTFDSANGDLYIANVGQEDWESIYYAPGGDPGGENYGWSIYEGTHPMKPQPAADTGHGITFPVAEFSHTGDGHFNSIIGGYVYRGAEFPHWRGVYFFSDWMTSQVWALRRDESGLWHTHQVDGGQCPVLQPDTFGQDEKGNLYLAGFADGKLYKLIERPEDN